jgi:hypothetical protein
MPTLVRDSPNGNKVGPGGKLVVIKVPAGLQCMFKDQSPRHELMRAAGIWALVLTFPGNEISTLWGVLLKMLKKSGSGSGFDPIKTRKALMACEKSRMECKTFLNHLSLAIEKIGGVMVPVDKLVAALNVGGHPIVFSAKSIAAEICGYRNPSKSIKSLGPDDKIKLLIRNSSGKHVYMWFLTFAGVQKLTRRHHVKKRHNAMKVLDQLLVEYRKGRTNAVELSGPDNINGDDEPIPTAADQLWLDQLPPRRAGLRHSRPLPRWNRPPAVLGGRV